MRVIKDFFAHPIIQTALVAGASTIILAYCSKRVFAEPLSNLELALPALLFTLWQGLAAAKKVKPWLKQPWVGMAVIVAVTGLVVVLNV